MAVDRSTGSLSTAEEIIAWWSNLAVVDRPARVTAERLMRELDKKEHDTVSKHVENHVRDTMEHLGFKRTLFEDGWYHVPPAKFALLKTLKVPSNNGLFPDPSRKFDKRVFVYFVQSVNGGPIKIGRSDDVVRRVSDMQTANPFRLRILLLLSDNEATEREMHDAFASLRIDGGEWFQPEKELLDFIEERVLKACGYESII